MSVSIEEREKLFRQFRHSVGAPIRQIELTDEQLCTLLEISIEDYAQYVQEWLIEHQWQSLLGHNLDTTDMAFALSVRSFDFMTQYTYAYSKQVGLQSNGPWELKKDYVEIEAGRQVYTIPAGREVNEVLWITPPATSQALLANYGGIDYGFGGGFAQVGGGVGTGGPGFSRMGYYIAPAFDILLTAADMNLKNRIVRSELVHKITAGPNGTKLLHLMSTPGSKLSFGQGIGGVGSSINMTGCQVWYHYYDTTPENVDQCRQDNPDIIKMPNQVPLAKLDYADFNEPTKTLIRQLFIAEAKRALGRTRGKFGGIVGPPEAERTMDYETLISEGNEEKKAVLERLEARLLRLSSTSQLERGAKEATDLNTAMKYRPLGFWVY
ncbi:MAG: hypothetical protein E6R13_02740 [Spirochaetes bacterium]|nr:MAG: hypothetical protein E6R13_02740 [Spirochaetota bacterium]